MPLRFLAAAIAALVLTACQPTDVDSAKRSVDEFSATGTVREIDPINRRFVLRIDEQILTLRANEAVAVFDILEVGDRVRVAYQESIAVDMADPNAPSETNVDTAGSAFVGEGLVGRGEAIVETTVVEFVSFDADSNIATLIDPDGDRFTLTVNSEFRPFALSRTPGERIQVTYSIALAVSLEIVETG